jgi:hypothetical protein
MKDAAHHIKYIQKKVIQSSRKSSGSSKSKIIESRNGTVVAEVYQPGIVMKRADTNHRAPLLRTNRSMIH